MTEQKPLDQAMDGERRIVTILFCDVKSSTAMAEKLDPEAWAGIMNRAYEHLIAPYWQVPISFCHKVSTI